MFTAMYVELQDRQIPQDDPRLMLVTQMYDNLRSRFRT